MSAYKELVERCAEASKYVQPYSGKHARIRAVLAEVFRTLETVTPEMVDAWMDAAFHDEPMDGLSAKDTNTHGARADWLAMLRASPLAPR